jgi:hypothetical protein
MSLTLLTWEMICSDSCSTVACYNIPFRVHAPCFGSDIVQHFQHLLALAENMDTGTVGTTIGFKGRFV